MRWLIRSQGNPWEKILLQRLRDQAKVYTRRQLRLWRRTFAADDIGETAMTIEAMQERQCKTRHQEMIARISMCNGMATTSTV